MTTVTTIKCKYCEGTGYRQFRRRYRCSRCGGDGYIEQRTTVASVDVGQGWFSNVAMEPEQRHDVAMLAAALGSPDWPPRS